MAFSRRPGFAEAVVAVGGDLVRADDQGVRVALHNRASLGFGEAGGGGGGVLARQGRLVGIRCDGFEGYLQACQKVPAKGGSGCENKQARHVADLK
jgi:hypothetical protein